MPMEDSRVHGEVVTQAGTLAVGEPNDSSSPRSSPRGPKIKKEKSSSKDDRGKELRISQEADRADVKTDTDSPTKKNIKSDKSNATEVAEIAGVSSKDRELTHGGSSLTLERGGQEVAMTDPVSPRPSSTGETSATNGLHRELSSSAVLRSSFKRGSLINLQGEDLIVQEDDEEGPRKMHVSNRAKPLVLEHKKNVLGEIVYKGHPSWVVMQNMQTGIRHSVGKAAALLDEQQLRRMKEISKTPQFYSSPPVLKFPKQGSSATQPHRTPAFKFKDYCPLVFRHLREKFKIDPADFMVSLCNTLDNGQNSLRLIPTPGKSGSLFFFSQDMKYIVKTIPKREAKLLRTLLPAYYHHVMENTSTLLPRFFGLYRVKPHKGRQVRLVVMSNIFATYKRIHERYDLKGSTQGREATETEKQRFKENVTYKDLDWRRQNKVLRLGGERKKMFLTQLARDCQLLERLNIMDYSLLVGIHYCTSNRICMCAREEAAAPEGSIPSLPTTPTLSSSMKLKPDDLSKSQENRDEEQLVSSVRRSLNKTDSKLEADAGKKDSPRKEHQQNSEGKGREVSEDHVADVSSKDGQKDVSKNETQTEKVSNKQSSSKPPKSPRGKADKQKETPASSPQPLSAAPSSEQLLSPVFSPVIEMPNPSSSRSAAAPASSSSSSSSSTAASHSVSASTPADSSSASSLPSSSSTATPSTSSSQGSAFSSSSAVSSSSPQNGSSSSSSASSGTEKPAPNGVPNNPSTNHGSSSSSSTSAASSSSASSSKTSTPSSSKPSTPSSGLLSNFLSFRKGGTKEPEAKETTKDKKEEKSKKEEESADSGSESDDDSEDTSASSSSSISLPSFSESSSLSNPDRPYIKERKSSMVMTNFPLPAEYHSQTISVFQQDDGGMQGRDEKGVLSNEYYYIGIIDILMLYTIRKQAEHAYKIFMNSKEQPSSVNPKQYSNRLQSFIASITK